MSFINNMRPGALSLKMFIFEEGVMNKWLRKRESFICAQETPAGARWPRRGQSA
jgi:hypothetical protein